MTDDDLDKLIEALEKGIATEEQQRLAAELLEKWIPKP
jgi:hypothetical protein